MCSIGLMMRLVVIRLSMTALKPLYRCMSTGETISMISIRIKYFHSFIVYCIVCSPPLIDLNSSHMCTEQPVLKIFFSLSFLSIFNSFVCLSRLCSVRNWRQIAAMQLRALGVIGAYVFYCCSKFCFGKKTSYKIWKL